MSENTPKGLNPEILKLQTREKLLQEQVKMSNDRRAVLLAMPQEQMLDHLLEMLEERNRVSGMILGCLLKAGARS